ncbi:MAG: hypothetical protein U0359_16055 [Byssovorax sp.]
MRPQSLASPSSPGADALSAWITSASPRRLLLIEDGSAGGGSPLAAWLANMRRSDTWEVVHISLGSTTNLFLERDILVALYRALFPDDHDAPATFSLAQLREHVSDGLSTSDEDRDRLVVIERANWGEDRFGQNIGYLLGRIDADQPVVVSLRVDGDLHPPISAWYEHLGWSASDTALLRLAAMPDGAGTPVEQARRDISSCRGSAGLVELLDLLAACLRPMSWASSGDLLGFEADVDRAWSVARRALVNDASNTQTSRRAPLVALFRCVQVSGSVMIRVRQAGSTAGPRAHALVALSNLLPDPARTSAREAAIDVLVPEPGGWCELSALTSRMPGGHREVAPGVSRTRGAPSRSALCPGERRARQGRAAAPAGRVPLMWSSTPGPSRSARAPRRYTMAIAEMAVDGH